MSIQEKKIAKSIRGKPVYHEILTVVEDCPDASTAFRSQGMDICGFFLQYAPWNGELDDRWW